MCGYVSSISGSNISGSDVGCIVGREMVIVVRFLIYLIFG